MQAFNDALAAAREFTEEIHSEMETFYNEKSDKWQEGDAGSAYQSWTGRMGKTSRMTSKKLRLRNSRRLTSPRGEIEEFENLPDAPE